MTPFPPDIMRMSAFTMATKIARYSRSRRIRQHYSFLPLRPMHSFRVCLLQTKVVFEVWNFWACLNDPHYKLLWTVPFPTCNSCANFGEDRLTRNRLDSRQKFWWSMHWPVKFDANFRADSNKISNKTSDNDTLGKYSWNGLSLLVTDFGFDNKGNM